MTNDFENKTRENTVQQKLLIDKESKAWKDGYDAGMRDDTAVEAARTLEIQEFGNWLDGYSTAWNDLIEGLKIGQRK